MEDTQNSVLMKTFYEITAIDVGPARRQVSRRCH
jgi:hypothetical protein